MSDQFWLGALAGGYAGAILVLVSLALAKGDVPARLSARAHVTPSESAGCGSGLTDHDRAQVADEFRIHADAVQRAVSDYADQLADGDPVLRARLRRFEAGER